MGTAKMSFGQVGYLLVLGVAIPVAVWHIAAGLYHLALIAAFATVVGVAIEVTGWNPWRVSGAFPRPELELMEEVGLPAVPATIRVVGARGVCPLGFGMSSTWKVDGEGRIRPWLCRPAVNALSPALESLLADGGGGSVSCSCPLGDRVLSFALAKGA